MKKIFFNPQTTPNQKVGSAYRQQIGFLRMVWEGDSFGLERFLRLLLCLAQFACPILLIREIFGRAGSTARKLAVEFYLLFKFFFPLIVLAGRFYRSSLIVCIVVYLLAETILHILNLIFLADGEEFSLSYHRAILILFLNFMQVAFDFAVVYIAFDLLSEPLNPVSAVYFSVVASTTVGFGDICAKTALGQLVVTAQLLINLAFVVVFINYFSQKTSKQ